VAGSGGLANSSQAAVMLAGMTEPSEMPTTSDDVERLVLPRLPAHLAAIRVEHCRPPRPLTREQAAELLGLHPRTLDRWVRRGRLGVIDLRGTVRIPVAEAARVSSIAAWTRFE
jgi:excisionase family DNA binding protein